MLRVIVYLSSEVREVLRCDKDGGDAGDFVKNGSSRRSVTTADVPPLSLRPLNMQFVPFKENLPMNLGIIIITLTSSY